MSSDRDFLKPLLDELDDVGASPGFAERTLSAARKRDRAGRVGRRLVPAVAAALVFGTFALVVSSQRSQRQSLVEEARSLRSQHRELERELSELRARTVDVLPVVSLGSHDRVEYVLDLTPSIDPALGGAENLQIVPAANASLATY